MKYSAPRVLPIIAAALLASACATSSPEAQLSQSTPWWEQAGPCRIWVPIEPRPGQTPAWDPGPSAMRLSNSGDCRYLQAALPDGAVLIGSP